MTNLNYGWLLVGCHHITEVAVAYFPNYSHNSSAVKAFRRSLGEHALLMEQLLAAGYTAKTLHLTPKQILPVVRCWGMPADVKEAVEANPYLAVPKMGRKI